MEKFLPNGQSFFVVGLAAVIWALWKSRNKALSAPNEIVYQACVFFFLEHWADLLNELSKEDLIRAMEGLHQTVAAVDRVTDFTNRQ
jgi:hypothetical protein